MSLRMLTDGDLETYERDGFLIVKRLFATDEVSALRTRFDQLAEVGRQVPNFFEPDLSTTDPLKRYPRVMHPHRWDALARSALLHRGVEAALCDLLRDAAVACQAMYYYKPCGSPGQSLHQDNFYLSVKPGNCIAAWTAIDPASPENGGMYLVPGSHKLGIFCPDVEDLPRRMTSNLVDTPPGMKAVPAVMEPGDTLFFDGSVIHGSGRNRSKTMWRRAFIGHYMPKSSTHLNPGYFPVLDFDGNEISYEAAAAGGPCGYPVGTARGTYGVDATLH